MIIEPLGEVLGGYAEDWANAGTGDAVDGKTFLFDPAIDRPDRDRAATSDLGNPEQPLSVPVIGLSVICPIHSCTWPDL